MRRRSNKLLIIIGILIFLSACEETVYKNPVINYESKFAYIPILDTDGRFKVVNTATSTLVTELFVGSNPTGVAINSDGSRAYVVLRPIDKQGEIVVIDTHTNSMLDENILNVGLNASGILYYPNPNQDALFVTHNNGVTRISVDTYDSYTVADTPIPVKYNSMGIEYLGDFLITTGSLYDSNGEIIDSGISLVDLTSDTVIEDLSMGNSGSAGIAVDEINNRIFVTNRANDNISIFTVSSSGLNETDTIDLKGGSYPLGISYDKTNQRLYIANSAQIQFQAGGDSTNGGISVVELKNNNKITYSELSYEGSPYAYAGAMHILMSQYDEDQERLYVIKDLWLPTSEHGGGGVYLSAMNVNLLEVDINSEKSVKVNENTKPQFVGRFIGPVCKKCPQGILPTTNSVNQQSGINGFLILLFSGLFLFLRRRNPH